MKVRIALYLALSSSFSELDRLSNISWEARVVLILRSSTNTLLGVSEFVYGRQLTTGEVGAEISMIVRKSLRIPIEAITT